MEKRGREGEGGGEGEGEGKRFYECGLPQLLPTMLKVVSKDGSQGSGNG